MGDKAWRVRLVSSVILAAVCIGGRRPALADNSQATPKAAEFFVSLQGNDAWSGRVAEPAENDGPFATVARAKQAVRELRRAQTEPVRVVLSGGTYFLAEPLDFWPSDSGTKEAPITYAAAPGEKVILSGGRRLTGGQWGEVNGQQAWVIDLPEVKIGKWTFRQLFVNGERRPRTRLPKQGEYQIEAVLDYDPKSPEYPYAFTQGTKRIVYKGTDIQPWHNLHDVEVVGVTCWHDEHLPLESVDVTSHTATFDRRSLFALFKSLTENPGVYWVENVREALDSPGQWYLDRLEGRLYYLPRQGEDMQAVEIIAPRLTQLVRVVGWEGKPVKHVNFEGLTFSHTEWQPPADWAASLQGSTDVPGALYFDYAQNCSVRGGAIEHIGTYGIQVNMGCLEIEISHNRMADLGAGGVNVGHFYSNERSEQGERRTAWLPKGPRSERITVADNEITGTGQIYAGSAGVVMGENPGNKVVHNHLHHLSWLGISVGSSDGEGEARGNVVEYNHVHHVGDGRMSDVGGIYTRSISPGTRIRYNVVHDIQHRDYGGWGIYTDQGTGEVLIEKNIVYRCSSGPLFVSISTNITVENNIFAFGADYQIFRAGCSDPTAFEYAFRRNIVYYNQGSVVGQWEPANRNFLYDHNLYWNTSGKVTVFTGDKSLDDWRAAGQDKNSIVADPLFVDPEKGDFRLRPGSPAAEIGFEPWDLMAVGPRRLPDASR